MHRATATVLPPALHNHATEAFRIADLKAESQTFLHEFSTLLSVVPNDGQDLNASDLRLQTLEEAIQTTLGYTQPQEVSEEEEISEASADEEYKPPRRTKGISRAKRLPPQPASAQRPPSAPSQGLDEAQLAKQQAIDTYNATVASIREKYEAERASASRHLRSLLQNEKMITERTRRSRSFSEVLHNVEGNPTMVVELAHAQQPGQIEENGVADATAAATCSTAPVPQGEVVLRIALHVPQTPAYVQEEWIVLGSQNLTQLRDRLYCLTEVNLKNIEKDENMRREAIGMAPLQISKPSAYFYLEGTFFVDGRIADSTDYSEAIRKYLKDNDIKAPPHASPGPASRPLVGVTNEYSVAAMEDTAFEDLWVRIGLGSAGLYCHQGGCEHLFVIKDVRLHDPSIDPPNISQYPYRVSNPGMTELSQKRRCEACGLRFAKRITHNDKAGPHSPFLWCEDCYKAMHYDAQGNVLYTDYTVFPYEGDYYPVVLHEKKSGG